MTQDELAQLSRDELIDLVLAEHGQLEVSLAQLEALQAAFAQLKVDVEVLKLKLEKGKKPPIAILICMQLRVNWWM